MKNFKFLLGVLAIVFTVASAFAVSKVSSAQQKATITTDHYFRYDGVDNSDPEIQDPNNWVYLGETPPSLGCSETSGVICYIKTTMDESTFFANLSSQTETSLAAAIQARKE